MIVLQAHWLTITDDNFKCEEYENTLRNRKDADVVIKATRLRKGCNTLSRDPKVTIENVGYHSCLCNPIFKHPHMQTFLQLHSLYQQGQLPFSGGALEQPAQIMDVLSLLDNFKSKWELEQQKKQLEKIKQKG